MFQITQASHDIGEVYPVLDLDYKLQRHVAVIIIRNTDVADIGSLGGYDGGNRRENAPLVGHFHANIGWELSRDVAFPLHIDPFVRVVAVLIDIGA